MFNRGTDLMAQTHLTFHPPQQPYGHLRPQCLADTELCPTTLSSTNIPASPHDEAHYIPGLNAIAGIFMTWWHVKQDRTHRTPEEVLERGLAHIQHTLDNLCPELRWRGGLSRPHGATWGHDAQMVYIMVTSLYMKSNLLQHIGVSSSKLTHRDIIRSVETATTSHFECSQNNPRGVGY